MPEQKTVRTIVGYSVDQQSVDSAVKSTDSVRAGIQNILVAAKSLDISGGSVGVQALNQQFATFSPRIESARNDIESLRAEITGLADDTGTAQNATVSWIGELDQLRQEILSSADAAKSAQEDVGGGDGGGGGISNVSGLRRAGGALTQLGLGEAGRGVSIAGDIAQLGKFKDIIGELSPATLAAGGAIAGFTVLLDLYTKAQQAAKVAAEGEIAGRQKAIELITTGTREQQQAELNKLEIQRKNNAAIAADANQLFQNIKDQVLATQGAGAAALEFFAAQAGKANGEYQAAFDSAKKANDALNSTSTEMGILTQATGLAAQGLDQIVTAAQKIELISSNISNKASADLQAYQIANDPKATTKGLDERIRALQLEFAVTKNSAEAAKSLADSYGRATAEGQAAQAEADKLTKHQNDLQTSIEALSQSFVRQAVTANETAAINEQIRVAESAAAKKFADDITSITDKKNQDEIKAYNNLIDKNVQIASKAVDDTQKALDQLAAKQASLQTSLLRSLDDDNAKAQFESLQRQEKFNEQEAVEAKKTKDKILDIQTSARDKEYELGLDRNFSAIAASRRQTAQQISQVNVDAQRAKEQRLQAFADENADRDAQFIFDRSQKLKHYAEALIDAQASEQAQLKTIQAEKKKQLLAAQAAYAKEYADLEQKYADQVTARQVAITTELTQIAAGEAGKLQIIETYAQAAKQILSGVFNTNNLPGGNGGSSTPIAGGNVSGGGGGIGLGLLGGGLPDYSTLGRGASSSSSSTSSLIVSIPVTINGGDTDKIVEKMTKVARDVTADAIVRMNQ